MPSLGSFGEKWDLNVRQGATFGPVRATMVNPPDDTHVAEWPFDLTACVIRGQIRRKPLDEVVIADIAVDITDAPGGIYQFGLPVSVTTALAAGATVDDAKSRYVYDIEMVLADGSVRPLYYGEVIVLREVTRG